jgi:putative FmdB family regulatory protein|tara:strand:+ start:1126 stop:1374 length:249 start_codon:yes stop_codon:yes gene_type:complete
MPIYLYECVDCEETFKVRHTMSETCECCALCAGKNVSRIPTSFTNLSKQKTIKKRTGDITNEFIENSKADLAAQMKELQKKR